MKLLRFDRLSDIERSALVLLREHLCMAGGEPHAVMLTGGQTPQGLYGMLKKAPLPVDDALCLLISDERHVPTDSPESNYGQMHDMVAALGMDEGRVLRVHTELPLSEAAQRYDAELAAFLDAGGRITLGLLGLGADGHVASLFDMEGLSRDEGKRAIAVPRQPGPDRISVTRRVLARTEHLVFLVAGPEKADIVDAMMNDPEELVAFQAVRDAPRVEIWYAQSH